MKYLEADAMWSNFFVILGLLTFLNFLYESLRSPLQLLYHKCLQYQNKDIPLTRKFGKWAAITGSTDGIGKAYSLELAKKGFNIVLISRNDGKLKTLAKEIEDKFGVDVFPVKADFTQGFSLYEKLFHELDKKPIELLVNNVGIGHNPPGTICTFTAQHLWDMMNVNIGAATQLSRYFIDLWYRTSKKGCIVNVSSITANSPCPYGAVYGATKAYLNSLTIALQHEVKSMGIEVQLLSPHFVATEINNYSTFIRKGYLLSPQPEIYAKWAVNTLGKCDMTTGYLWHGIMHTILSVLPLRWRCKLVMLHCSVFSDNVSNFLDKFQTSKEEIAK
ncbi:inactive hydroxysteroid dehydrogenase-like protein 1 [Haematobia irritans]|uniref:inactive hydroxysteroid dehydrogenase-like protein 1 n=1 Tax=Haematobia irritans TaxID=7368 RepID=UPI003F50BB1E